MPGRVPCYAVPLWAEMQRSFVHDYQKPTVFRFSSRRSHGQRLLFYTPQSKSEIYNLGTPPLSGMLGCAWPSYGLAGFPAGLLANQHAQEPISMLPSRGATKKRHTCSGRRQTHVQLKSNVQTHIYIYTSHVVRLVIQQQQR